MVNVFIIEDSDEKREAIAQEVSSFFGKGAYFDYAATFSEVANQIFKKKYDLIITDLLLPRRKGDVPADFSEDLVDYVSTSEVNSQSVFVALTQFSEIVDERLSQFTARGIFLLPYDGAGAWRASLRICMQRVNQKMSYRFVIICALEKERAAFREVEGLEFGEFSTHHGLDCVEIVLSGQRGVCVVQPRMGLVDAAAVATRALTVFNPAIIAMAGICAGFKDEVSLGALAVSDICWDHQAGKWSGDEFEISNYQESIDAEARSVIIRLLLEDPELKSYRYNLRELQRPSDRPVAIVPSVSGSAVIASDLYMAQIKKAHRKLASLDMEVYSIYRAAALYGGSISCFAAKTVVDLADEKKDDRFHHDGTLLSARFVAAAIARLLA